jgi:hypothetical protein
MDDPTGLRNVIVTFRDISRAITQPRQSDIFALADEILKANPNVKPNIDLKPQIEAMKKWIPTAVATSTALATPSPIPPPVPQGTLSEFTLAQRHVKLLATVPGGTLAFYVANIHKTRPTRCLLFITNQNWNEAHPIDYNTLKQQLAGSRDVAEAELHDKRSQDFRVASRNYRVTFSVDWHPFGDDYAKISIEQK